MKSIYIVTITFLLAMYTVFAEAGVLYMSIRNNTSTSCYPIKVTGYFAKEVALPFQIRPNDTVNTTIVPSFSRGSVDIIRLIFRCGEAPNEKYIGLETTHDEPTSIPIILLGGILGGDLPYYGGVHGEVLKQYTDKTISASFTGSPGKTRLKDQDGYAQWVIQ